MPDSFNINPIHDKPKTPQKVPEPLIKGEDAKIQEKGKEALQKPQPQPIKGWGRNRGAIHQEDTPTPVGPETLGIGRNRASSAEAESVELPLTAEKTDTIAQDVLEALRATISVERSLKSTQASKTPKEGAHRAILIDDKLYIDEKDKLGKGTFRRVRLYKLDTKKVAIGFSNPDKHLEKKYGFVDPSEKEKIVADQKREGLFLEKLKGKPGVVETHKVTNYESGEQTVILKFYNQGTLLDNLSTFDTSLTYRQKTKLAIQLLIGLSHIHDANIIHDDLKPENILINIDEKGEYEIVIADFGLAEEGEVSSCLKGNFLYLDPQGYEGHPGTKAADVYSMGLILSLLFSGSPHPLPSFTLKHDDDIIKFIKGESTVFPNQEKFVKIIKDRLKEDHFDIPDENTPEYEAWKLTPPYVLWRMLDPNPASRITSHQALKALEEALPKLRF